MKDPNYYPKCMEIIKQKITKTRWVIKPPDQRVVLDFKDYFETFIGHNKCIGIFQKRSTLQGKKNQSNTYDIETQAFINYDTEQVNSIVFSKKVPTPTPYFTVRQPHDIKKISIAAYSFNDVCEPALVNNFDPTGHPHKNDFSIYNNIEKPYYEQYFKEYAPAPHFHFNTQLQDAKLKRPNAISIEDIVQYLNDLESNTYDYFLQNDSMGMPFLAIKNNQLNYFGTLRKLAEKYTQNNYDENIVDFFYNSLNRLNLIESSANTWERPFKNLQVDMNTLMELKKCHPEYTDIIGSFGYHILTSLNQNTISDIDNDNQDKYNK